MEFVSGSINEYCVKHSTAISKICNDIEAFTFKNVERPQMVSGALVGSFLGYLVSSRSAKRVLEIGTFTGFSALAMAERLPSDGTVTTIDSNAVTTKVAQGFWEQSPHGKKIRSIIGSALAELDTLEPGFDFVFIDADKPNYLSYLKKSISLIGVNGMIALDNCLWSGNVLRASDIDEDTRAIKSVNEFILASSELEKVLLPVRDGIFLVSKKPRA